MLEVLEDRRVPSSMAKSLGWEVAQGQLTLSQAVALGDVVTPPSATIDFARFAAVHGTADVRLLVGREEHVLVTTDTGSTYHTIKDVVSLARAVVGATTEADPANAAAAANAVFAALPKSTVVGEAHTEGFDATLDGARILIKGYYDAKGKPRDITEPRVEVSGTPLADPPPVPKVAFAPRLIYRGGDSGSASLLPGKGVAFSFKPGPDNNLALQGDAVAEGDIDGITFSAVVHAGESYLQVADDVAASLAGAGLPGVHADGRGDVVFAQDFSGRPVSELTISGIDGLAVGAGSHKEI